MKPAELRFIAIFFPFSEVDQESKIGDLQEMRGGCKNNRINPQIVN